MCSITCPSQPERACPVVVTMCCHGVPAPRPPATVEDFCFKYLKVLVMGKADVPQVGEGVGDTHWVMYV